MLVREALFDLYVTQQLSCKRIEEKTGISDSTVQRWLWKYGIPARSRWHARIGTHRTEETKRKISAANKGHTSWSKGKIFSKEYRQRISIAKLQFKCSKEVLCSLYWEDGFTLAQIAVIFGVSVQTVLNRMRRLDIPRRSHSEALIGVNHWNWRGGSVPVRGKWWRKLREKVLVRDNYTCQLCGVYRAKTLIVHHILPYRSYKNNDLDKLVTLCRSCHSKIENGRRKGVELYESIINTPTD